MSRRSHVFNTHTFILERTLSHRVAVSRSSCFPALHGRQRRGYATVRDREAPSIGILGGGITGLATAYYISKQLPKARITIYEKSRRIGGWVNSQRVDTATGQVLFETGCRSLRSAGNGIVTTHLIQELGLQQGVLYTSRHSVSARNRYIYYPDRLVHLPGAGMSPLEILGKILFEPVLRGIFPAFLQDMRADARPDSLTDESVGDFLSRRLSRSLAQNLASAVMHGIYAGDVWQLSARSLLPLQWHLEKEHGGLMRGLINVAPNQLMKARDVELRQELRPDLLDQDFGRQISDSSVFTFKDGLQQLPDKLEEVLEARGVERKKSTAALLLRYRQETDTVDLHTAPSSHVDAYLASDPSSTSSALGTLSQTLSLALSNPEIQPDQLAQPVIKATTRNEHDYVISTIFSRDLAWLTLDPKNRLTPEPLLTSLRNVQAVTVMVVNLFYASRKILPVAGFGYLIPQSVPFEQNPERALGVVFDSDAVSNQDTAEGTKVTVMLGGHLWDGWESYPSASDAIEMAKSVLARHLRVHEDPIAAQASLQRDCIPQYKVGHATKMSIAHEELQLHFKGKLKVAGNSYVGVGVNDCLRSALDVSRNFATNRAAMTGLEAFGDEDKWALVTIQQGGDESQS